MAMVAQASFLLRNDAAPSVSRRGQIVRGCRRIIVLEVWKKEVEVCKGRACQKGAPNKRSVCSRKARLGNREARGGSRARGETR
jgi:hypothetical protein